MRYIWILKTRYIGHDERKFADINYYSSKRKALKIYTAMTNEDMRGNTYYSVAIVARPEDHVFESEGTKFTPSITSIEKQWLR